MAITRWRPVSELQKYDDADCVMYTDDVVCSLLACYEQKNGLVIEMHIPGIDVDTLFVGVEGSTLMITGQISELYTGMRKEFENFFELPVQVMQKNITIDSLSHIVRIIFDK